METFLYYLSLEHVLPTIIIPFGFVAYWLSREQTDRNVLFHWVPCTIMTYIYSWWVITPDVIQLHMIDIFFFYLAIYLYAGYKISPLSAYALSYLSIVIPDIMRASELIRMGYADVNTFYFGVGGAGLGDGLVIVPILSAALVHYVAWRRRPSLSSCIKN